MGIEGALLLPVSPAVPRMVIHHTGCLHIGVNDCRTDEAHTAALQVYRQNVAFGC